MKIVNKTLILDTSWGTGKYIARSWGLFVCCPSNLGEDILQHELQHAKDWRANPIQYTFQYHFNSTYRLWAELRGYSHNKSTPEETASLLNKEYGFGFTISSEDVSFLSKVCVNHKFKDCEKLIKLRMSL